VIGGTIRLGKLVNDILFSFEYLLSQYTVRIFKSQALNPKTPKERRINTKCMSIHLEERNKPIPSSARLTSS